MTDSQPRDALQRPLVTDQPPASPASPESPAGPRPAGVPWTVRVADWSARHRWPVFVLWFVATIGLFVGSLAAGGTNSAEAVSNDDRAKYEAAEAFIVWNAANAGAQSEDTASAQFLLVVTNPDGTIDDASYQDAISDMSSRLGKLEATVDGKTGPVFEQLVDPTQAPPEAGLISPDKTTARIAARVPGDGDVLVEAHAGAQVAHVERAHVVAVHAHGAALRIVEAHEQAGDRGLSRASRTHQRHLLARRDLEGDVLQDPVFIAIGE